jgi:hypothetical protein
MASVFGRDVRPRRRDYTRGVGFSARRGKKKFQTLEAAAPWLAVVAWLPWHAATSTGTTCGPEPMLGFWCLHAGRRHGVQRLASSECALCPNGTRPHCVDSLLLDCHKKRRIGQKVPLHAKKLHGHGWDLITFTDGLPFADGSIPHP